MNMYTYNHTIQNLQDHVKRRSSL